MHSDYNIIYNSTNWKPSIKKSIIEKHSIKVWFGHGFEQACKHYMIIMQLRLLQSCYL